MDDSDVLIYLFGFWVFLGMDGYKSTMFLCKRAGSWVLDRY